MTTTPEGHRYLATNTRTNMSRTYTIAKHIIEQGKLDWAREQVREWAATDLRAELGDIKLERIWRRHELLHDIGKGLESP